MRFLLTGLLLLTPWLGHAADRELLSDTGFHRGFRVIAPSAGKRVSIGQLAGDDASAKPAWDLDQWHSRFPFTSPPGLRVGAHLVYSNTAKWVVVNAGTLTLGVDSRPEYTNTLRRTPAEPWVHLLAEQALENGPSLREMRTLQLRCTARLTEAETFRPVGYTADLHAAQFQLVVTLANTRRESPGYGDFLWFVVPLYDDRHAQPPRYLNRDFADASAKFIFNPGTDAFTPQHLRDGQWVKIDRDLRPLLLEALKEAWQRGYLRDSRDLADYRLTTLNLGWEVPGLNRVALAVRDLSLRAEVSGE